MTAHRTLYNQVRKMPKRFSERNIKEDDGKGNKKNSRYFWRWHYRALKVQGLYVSKIAVCIHEQTDERINKRVNV